MSVKQSSVQSHAAAAQPEESQSVYSTLFSKINLSPVEAFGALDNFQSNDALSDTSVDERVTAAVSVFLNLLKQGARKVERLDKTLLDEHIASLDAQISQQLDAVMHHPDFQRVESTWRGVKSLIDQTDFRQNVRIELLDISKDHLVQDFEDAPEIAQAAYMSMPILRNTTRPGASRLLPPFPTTNSTVAPRTSLCCAAFPRSPQRRTCPSSARWVLRSSARSPWKRSPQSRTSATTSTGRNTSNGNPFATVTIPATSV
jgi:hypothetical protein